MKINEILKTPKNSLDTTSSGTIYSISSEPATQDIVSLDHVPEKIAGKTQTVASKRIKGKKYGGPLPDYSK